MKVKPMTRPNGRLACLIGLAAILLGAVTMPAKAQTSPSPSQGVLGVWTDSNSGPSTKATSNVTEPLPGLAGNAMPIADPKVEQAGCASCGRGLVGGAGGEYMGLGSTDPCAGGCVPGHRRCDCCISQDTYIGRLVGGLYECICCPDPCYEPHWVAAADVAFFQDAARPVTQTRLRWDTGWDLIDPDRAEYFWAREKSSLGPNVIAHHVNYRELSLYTEAATDRIGVFVEEPYREVGVHVSPISPTGDGTFSGFGDLNIGSKTLLMDCDLMQFSFQFKTFILSGSSNKGLGTGHVSLEPAFLLTLHLAPDTYLQAETAYWIPVGGDRLYQGNVFHGHLAINQVLWRICHDVQIVGTAEFNEWSVVNGNFTDPGTGLPDRARASMFSLGPGARLVICDRIDIGAGTAFSVTGARWAEELVRAEFRWRF
jgi:Putative MetA-pathway of phenol degradation